jgi:hypothetical protein
VHTLEREAAVRAEPGDAFDLALRQIVDFDLLRPDFFEVVERDTVGNLALLAVTVADAPKDVEVHPAGEFLGVASLDGTLHNAFRVPMRLLAHATTPRTTTF